MSETRKQIIEKIGAAENILITVSKSPSVDALAAALGLTIALNKSGKRATAVTSGKMPDALEFLRPEKTFENSVDSLRDFIIALNKEKADHLRYKVVGDHVKIFITPYRTTLTSDDLEFEQGDFNVDLVLAIGVRDKSDLDSALAAHGRIFHDATVGVLTVGEQASSLSDINWHNFDAGALSEITLELVLELNKNLLSKSVATAFLTGLVAATDRFSNAKASANVMNLASKLIVAGADQQLVISKIKEAEKKAQTDTKEAIKQADNGLRVPKNQTTTPSEPTEAAQPIDSISIDHNDDSTVSNRQDFVDAPTDDNLANNLNEPEPTKPEPAKQVVEANFSVEKSADSDEDELEKSLDQLSKISNDLDNLTLDEDLASQLSSNSNDKTESIEQDLIEKHDSQPTVVAPIKNFAPNIPSPSAPISNEPAFISEQPIATDEFKPAKRPDELAQGDDYFHPEANQQTKAKILKHTSPINPDQMTSRQAEPHNQEVIPAAQNPGIGQTIQPISAKPEEAKPNQNPQAQPSAEIYGGFPPPPPPIPDFSNMPLPPDFNLPPVAPVNIPADVAMGVEASTKNIMTDQVYPTPPNNDPAQFKIPGM